METLWILHGIYMTILSYGLSCTEKVSRKMICIERVGNIKHVYTSDIQQLQTLDDACTDASW